MKAHSSYFKRKNSKQGLALSTAMAICIVLAILVAVLVSMASLNITTTQSTVSQREAYIQAKSAIAFAESYYSQHDIPGKDDTTGEALIVFHDSVISNGANVYVTKDSTVTLDAATVEKYKEDCPDTYVEVLKSGNYLDLTAHCKYGNGDYYELAKEFSLGSNEEKRPNSFTGNISYEANSDTRYLRIHVRTTPAFDGHPYLYTWYTSVNSDTGDSAYGRSSIVNKMSEDVEYATVANGDWDPTSGPVGDCAMSYEGNGWYVTEIKFGTKTNVNFINAIVTKNGAVRTKGDDQQSWEFFGIPVPSNDNSGEAMGLDVYITLNRSKLRDARNDGANDEFTEFYETQGSINNFAKFCGSWYTIYTKKDTSTLHYRKQGVYDDSEGVPGFTYEGYGWWRKTTNSFSDTVTIGGNTYSFEQAQTIDQNEFGREVVKEGFICELEDGSVGLYNSEEEANNAFADAGEVKAGDYVTINVNASSQPVDHAVDTKIYYNSKWDKSSGGSDPSTEPTGAKGSELEVEKLASNPWEAEYALIGDSKINDWGRSGGSEDHRYENLGNQFKFDHTSDNIYELTIENCVQDKYTFKVIEVKKDSGSIDAEVEAGQNGWTFAYGSGNDSDGNTVYEILKDGNTMKIVFNSSTKEITVTQEDPNNDNNGSDRYAIIGWENEWGTKKGSESYPNADFAATDDMTYYEEGGVYKYTSDVVYSGKEYSFKIIKKTADAGVIGDAEWANSYGNGDEDVKFTPPDINGNPATYKVVITFDPSNASINITYESTGVAGEEFYLIGNYNNWGMNHTFNEATSTLYQLQPTGETDAQGRYLYKYTPGESFEAGDYEVKVISSKSIKEGVDGSLEESINYEHSWGEVDSAGITYGSSKNDGSNREGLKFSIPKRSNVEFTFAYDPNGFTASRITYVTTNSDDVGTKTIKFHNGPGKDEDNNPTEFTVPWTELYITYTTKLNKVPKCIKVEIEDGTTDVVCVIPGDAESFYFSNKYSITERGSEGYEYTQTITDIVANKTYRPTKAKTTTDGKEWELTNKTSRPVDAISGSGTMAYSGSSQNNYYDAPLVKVLNMIVSHGDPDGGGTKYAFAAYPYRDFGVNGGAGKVTFNTRNYITYQGEKYYYVRGKSYNGYSFLIVQDSSKKKGGILLENHMALITDTYPDSLKTKMDNRGGAIFTSDETYYDGSKSWFNYGGYTPNWYTFKVPVTTELTIEKIEGVTSSGASFLDSSGDPFTPANASDNYKQPIYISREYKEVSTGSYAEVEKYYTYNTKIGNVDTTKEDKVSVYFANNGTGDKHWSEVSVYAYDPLGNKQTKKLSIDSTDADHNYYRYEFDSGRFCYFQFFDSSTGSNPEDATKKTDVLFLTGNEKSDTREYEILALNGDSKSFTWYLHPKTQALYASIALDSAAAAARIPEGYTYNVKTGEYTSTGTLNMSGLSSKAASALDYAENGSGGKWSATDPSSYDLLARTVQEFVRTVQNARIYIAEEVPEVNPDSSETAYRGSGRVFKEGSYRDDTILYQDRWVNRLISVYNTAMNVYSSPSKQTDVGYLQACINDINNLIDSPWVERNPDTVEIIVDDQVVKDEDGNVSGGWGKSNIHLYNKAADDTWTEVGYDLYDTTQSGFYAYVFKLKYDTNDYMIAMSTPSDTHAMTLQSGKQYMFHTSDSSFEEDKSIATYKITDTEIKQGTATESFSQIKTRAGDSAFVLYFMYDTKVTFSGGSYTVYAGAYTISSAYSGFNKDFSSSGETGIDLFTENAKKYFTNPTIYGMTSADSFSTWDSDKLDSGDDIDIMFDRINQPSQISATTSSTKKIGFRYKTTKDNYTLKLNQKVSLEGGVITIAVNKIDLNNYDVELKAKTIVFQTDTTVVTRNGEFKVAHGTYALNESETGSTETVSLQTTGGDPDWRDNYTLIDESPSTLRGGYYIANK